MFIEGIIINVVTSIGEALFGGFIGLVNKKRNKKLIERICIKSLSNFKGTSIDSEEFRELSKSGEFISILRLYYFSLNKVSSKHITFINLCNLIKRKCPNVDIEDIQGFFDEIDIIFSEINQKILFSDKQSFALMNTIIKANKIIIEKICESEENFVNYINNINKIKKFDDKIIDIYHQNCISEFDKINFTGIVGAERKSTYKLEQLYIENDLYINYNEIYNAFQLGIEEKDKSKIKFQDFFKFSNRVVILGGAGFGKSTCLNYIFCNYEKKFNDTALKIKLNLKDHSKSIINTKNGLLDCLCMEFQKRVPHNLLRSYDVMASLAQHLYEGNCLLIFDALDEVTLQSERDKIRDEISNFCNVYFLNKYIITSREVGYLRNKFDESFLHLRIGLFNRKQIETYTKKWFLLFNLDDKNSNTFQKYMEEVKKQIV